MRRGKRKDQPLKNASSSRTTRETNSSSSIELLGTREGVKSEGRIESVRSRARERQGKVAKLTLQHMSISSPILSLVHPPSNPTAEVERLQNLTCPRSVPSTKSLERFFAVNRVPSTRLVRLQSQTAYPEALGAWRLSSSRVPSTRIAYVARVGVGCLWRATGRRIQLGKRRRQRRGLSGRRRTSRRGSCEHVELSSSLRYVGGCRAISETLHTTRRGKGKGRNGHRVNGHSRVCATRSVKKEKDSNLESWT